MTYSCVKWLTYTTYDSYECTHAYDIWLTHMSQSLYTWIRASHTLIWLTHMSDSLICVTHSYDSLIWVTHSYDSLICVSHTWLIICVSDTWFVNMCDMIQPYRHFFFPMCEATHSYVTWFVDLRDMTQPHMTWIFHTWRDINFFLNDSLASAHSFLFCQSYAAWHFQMWQGALVCDMTHSHMTRWCVTSFESCQSYVAWRFHTWHGSFICDMTRWYMTRR